MDRKTHNIFCRPSETATGDILRIIHVARIDSDIKFREQIPWKVSITDESTICSMSFASWLTMFIKKTAVFWMNVTLTKVWKLIFATLTHWGRDKMAAFSQTTLSNEFSWIKILEFRLKIPKVLINNIPALVLILAWRRPGDKPLSEPMLVRSLTHICVIRPQWVNDDDPRSFFTNRDYLSQYRDHGVHK